jgi:predicted dehydrogenase
MASQGRHPTVNFKKPKLGFLGVGWIGRHRLEAVANANTAEIAVLADPESDNLAAANVIAQDAALVDSIDALLEHDLDGVVIATPSALHAQQSIQALERGLAVFCQKPLARDGREVSAVVDAARKVDRLLGVDLSYRHVQGLIAIRDIISRNGLGTVFAADVVFHNANGPGKPWFYDRAQSGGGCLIDLGIHLVDAALWILRSHVVGVSSALFAEGQRLKPGAQAIEDYASARLELAAGTIVNLACSWKAHAGQDAVIEVTFYGTDGGATLRNVNGSFTEFRAERFAGTTRQILAEPPDPWGGGAILAWVRQLQESPRFDHAIEEHEEVARVLDRIYGEPAEVQP